MKCMLKLEVIHSIIYSYKSLLSFSAIVVPERSMICFYALHLRLTYLQEIQSCKENPCLVVK